MDWWNSIQRCMGFSVFMQFSVPCLLRHSQKHFLLSCETLWINLPYLFLWKDKYLWPHNAFLSIINRSQSLFDSVSLLQFLLSLRNVTPWMFENPLHFIWLGKIDKNKKIKNLFFIQPNFLIWCLNYCETMLWKWFVYNHPFVCMYTCM